MPYPAKTDREAILAAAIGMATREGLKDLSLRSVAAELGLAPNALYRYFNDRADIEAAISTHAASLVHAELAAAIGKKAPPAALRAIAQAYIHFARTQPHLYEIFMACRAKSEDVATAHNQLWTFVLTQVARLTGDTKSPDATIALWAFLHGFAQLEAAGGLGDQKPDTSFNIGLNAWLNYFGAK